MPHDARLTKTTPIRPAPPVPDGTPADDGDPDAERIRPAARHALVGRAADAILRSGQCSPWVTETRARDAAHAAVHALLVEHDPMAGDKSR